MGKQRDWACLPILLVGIACLVTALLGLTKLVLDGVPLAGKLISRVSEGDPAAVMVLVAILIVVATIIGMVTAVSRRPRLTARSARRTIGPRGGEHVGGAEGSGDS